MDTSKLRKFAQFARRQLHQEVAARLARVLSADSPESRARPRTVSDLRQQVKEQGRQAVVERVAYIWFNRFCALRFMDANRYTRMGIVSPLPGQFQPEILQEAKQGHIDDDLPLANAERQRVFDLLSGRLPAPDAQQEAYRLLLVAACNSYHKSMPFLFEKIDDYSELLMPDDLLSGSAILAYVREAMTPDVCQDVEVIGWLYQFYISEKKDEVFASKAKISAAEIPAATQLFTPHWIVRYLVENSLGRLWMLNRPGSKLAERMDYYIGEQGSGTGDWGQQTADGGSPLAIRPSPLAPRHTPPTDFLHISSPTDIRLCDPAVGSGHMLTYAFDLLYAIYAEEGYPPSDIPRLILTHNLYGMEIDERAGGLAAFALTMKAREKDRRFLSRGIAPHICVLRPVTFSDAELDGLGWLQKLGQNLVELPLADALLADLRAAALLDNVGSLLRPHLSLDQIADVRGVIAEADDLFTQKLNDRVRAVLDQMAYLARPYEVVVANPPYMGGGNANDELKAFAQSQYPESKVDLFAMFIERNLELARRKGLVAMITMQSWMFLSSYEKLRAKLLKEQTILSMAHLGPRAFDTIGGEVVSTTAFVLERAARPTHKGAYMRLIDGRSEAEKADQFRAALSAPLYQAAALDFYKIPGYPIAYWVSDNVRKIFEENDSLGSLVNARVGLMTSDNSRFLRFWWEVYDESICFNADNSQQAMRSRKKWFPHNKGGSFRKWAGNQEYLVNWGENGREIKELVVQKYPYLKGNPNFVVHDDGYYFKPFVSWSEITTGTNAFRSYPKGFTFNVKGMSVFVDDRCSEEQLLAYCNNKFVNSITGVLNPSMSFGVGDFNVLPAALLPHETVVNKTRRLVSQAQSDWDSYETSWDFSDLPLLRDEFRRGSLAVTYAAMRSHWQANTDEMQRLEEENNRLFIDAYGLQDELSPQIPLAEITLTCNPHYRYNSSNKSDEELEALLLADTMREFISYAVGCMFGRYSLDKPGLILADAGQGMEAYELRIAGGADKMTGGQDDRMTETRDDDGSRSTQHAADPRNSPPAPRPSFPPDKDNVIPILDGDWFPDEISERFKRFLRVTFGEAGYAENLRFIESALGRDIRSYFLRDFYDDHVKRYQKRPIYWLFSSPKGSFNALIYLHRYRPDTVSVVLNDYLREFRAKLTSHRAHLAGVSISVGATPREKSQALKEIDKLDKTLAELKEYEDGVLYPLATRQVEIDLDDGVKVNYGKLGEALKAVKGL